MGGTPIGNTSNINIASKSGKYSLEVTNTFGGRVAEPGRYGMAGSGAGGEPQEQLYAGGSGLCKLPVVPEQQPAGRSDGRHAGVHGERRVQGSCDGCERLRGLLNQFFISNVGIISTAVGNAIRVYPNPTSGIVHIESGVKVKVVLRDVAGKSVLEAEDVKTIDLGDIANGMYCCYISDLDGQLLKAEKVTKTNR